MFVCVCAVLRSAFPPSGDCEAAEHLIVFIVKLRWRVEAMTANANLSDEALTSHSLFTEQMHEAKVDSLDFASQRILI